MMSALMENDLLQICCIILQYTAQFYNIDNNKSFAEPKHYIINSSTINCLTVEADSL